MMRNESRYTVMLLSAQYVSNTLNSSNRDTLSLYNPKGFNSSKGGMDDRMSTARLEIIEFATLANKYIVNKGLGTGAIADKLDRLCRDAVSLHTIYEAMCNRDITQREEVHRENTRQEVDRICQELFQCEVLTTIDNVPQYTPYVEHQQDPRGPPVRIYPAQNVCIVVPY